MGKGLEEDDGLEPHALCEFREPSLDARDVQLEQGTRSGQRARIEAGVEVTGSGHLEERKGEEGFHLGGALGVEPILAPDSCV